MQDKTKKGPGSESEGNGGPTYAPESGLSLFVKLFIIPAGIVLVALGIFFLGTLALQHPKSAEQYLEELKSDSTSRRWQAAYELSRMLNQGEKVQFDDNLKAELVKTFEGAAQDDPRIREYLALVLGRLKERSAVPALASALKDESVDVKVYSLWAIGNIEDPSGGASVVSALSDPDLGVQRMAVGALSALRYRPAQSALEAELDNTHQGLRYDSAVALARLGDDKCLPVLKEMMGLKPTGKPEDDAMVQSAKLAAIDASREIKDTVLHAMVVDLGKNDPDLKVREAALDALKK